MRTKDAIVEDPRVMNGVPVFNGTRVPIANVLASLRAGFTFEQIREEYPFLTKELVDAALVYVPQPPTELDQRRVERSRRTLVSSERIELPPRCD